MRRNYFTLARSNERGARDGGQGAGVREQGTEGDCRRKWERNLGNIGTLEHNIVTREEEEGSLERLAPSWPGCGTGWVFAPTLSSGAKCWARGVGGNGCGGSIYGVGLGP